LNDNKKVTIFSKLKTRILENEFKKAAMKVDSVLHQIEKNTKNFNFDSDDLDLFIG